MGGDGLASLFLQADEVHHSMWGLVFHELKSFFESRTHTSYRDLATTMNLMFDNTKEEDSGDSSDPGPATGQATVQPPWMVAALAAEEGAHSHSDLLTLEERAFAARVIEGEHHVKTAGVENPMWGDRQKPVPLDEPILFTFEDYRNARVKHSAAPARLTRHIRQLSIVYKKSFPRARAKLLSRCGGRRVKTWVKKRVKTRQKGDRLIPLVMSEHGAMGAHFKAYLEELATLAVNKPGGVQSMRGTFAVSKYVTKAMLVRRWTARIVWGMQRQAAAQILATWRANAFLTSRSQSAAAGASPAVGAAVPPARALGMSTEDGILLDDLD